MNTPLLVSVLSALGFCSAAMASCPSCFSPEAKEMMSDAVAVQPSAHQLNVIYFLGTDNQPVADYERRLSELLLYLQQYYAKEMQRNGFGCRAFGLKLKDNGLVDILLIRGDEPSSRYAYNDGGNGRCQAVIQKYFKDHPEKKLSQHNFIIMPTFYDSEYSDKNPGGVPFYGCGTDCFALDYADFELKHLGKDTPEGRLLTKWYGGFAHELGHGLNLPHNDGTASQNKAMGTAMMNSGNYTFGMSPTYFTKASCAILDRSETFAPQGDDTVFYPAIPVEPTMSGTLLHYGKDVMSVRFRSTGNWTNINAYVQEPPYVVNQDYDAVAFPCDCSAPAEDGSREVTVSIPYAELSRLTHPTDRQLTIYFIGKDGNRYRWDYALDLKAMQAGKDQDVSLPDAKLPQSWY